MITIDRSVYIARPLADVFAFLDDFSKTPIWREQCVEVKQVSPGPRLAGAKLFYQYKEPGREGTMDGEIGAYDPAAGRLVMLFHDRIVDVAIDFRCEVSGTGTRVAERIEIIPKGLVTKLMTPIIRNATQRATDRELTKLKDILERPAAKAG